jgi:hypothetical protein
MEGVYANRPTKPRLIRGFVYLDLALDGTWRGNREHIRLAVIYPDFIAGRRWAPPFER